MVGTLVRRGWVVLGAVCLAVGAVAVAQAAIPDSGGVIHGCYKQNGGDLRVVDNPACKNNETALAWGQTGPRGPQGPQGPVGPQGPAGANASSHVYVSDIVKNDHLSDAEYTVGLTLPAGIYMVWLNVETYYDNSSSGFNSQCALWRNDPVGTPDDDTDQFFSAIGDSANFDGKEDEQGMVRMMAVVTLQADNEQILGFCHSDSDDDRKFAVSQMFAMPVTAVN
ncbi:MAG: hypothetical protein QOG82_2411 [Actinomycetota bacterium]|jgi:hypothetical protein|nr:hypothetical protein [Actinomycetota bacterium]